MSRKKEVYQGAIATKVQIIDWSKINKKISDTVGYEVECRVGDAYIPKITGIFDKDKNVEETRSMIFDNECCGVTSKTKNFLISDLIPTDRGTFSASLFEGIGFFKVSKPNEDGRRSMAIFPSFYFSIDEDDIKECLTGEEMPLYLYMNGRYDYNSRVRNNERETLSLVYHQESEIDIDLNGSKSKVKWNDKVEMAWETE